MYHAVQGTYPETPGVVSNKWYLIVKRILAKLEIALRLQNALRDHKTLEIFCLSKRIITIEAYARNISVVVIIQDLNDIWYC